MRSETRFCRNLTGQSLTPPPQAKTGREESFQTRVSSWIFGFGYGRVMYGELSDEHIECLDSLPEQQKTHTPDIRRHR